MTALLARCHGYVGNWDTAYDLARSVLTAREVAPGSRFEALVVAGLILTRKGDLGAQPLLDEALAPARASGCVYFMGPVCAARAEAAFLTGDLAGAVTEARAAFDLAVARGHPWYVGELAYWRWQGGDLTVAPQTIATPYARHLAGDWAGAAAAWDALGCPYEAARARLESYDETALRHALIVFERLGAFPAENLTRARLRELGATHVPRGPRPSTRANPAGLTAREVDVIHLLAEGLANLDIAERLFISPRTVENHVAAILVKLGATSRAEASVAARQLGIVPQISSRAAAH
jgi:DNA-binding CsgD family transcriptional regulator